MSLRKMQSIEDQLKTEKTILSWSLLVYETIIIIFYGFFLRFTPFSASTPTDAGAFSSAFIGDFYSIFQDVNVMMLVGFGFLMTFIKTYCWSALSYTFLAYAIVVQFYFLAAAFWERVFHGHWGDPILLT